MTFLHAPAPRLPHRALHLDLKGLPPTPARLAELPSLAARGGYNALVVEFEDSFPWSCDERFRSPTAYTVTEIRSFAAGAAAAGVAIIPLVQCLGHMETPLRYRPELREVPAHADVLNVLAPGARELVAAMVDDILELLPNVKHFHLGGDEAWSFGEHPDTAAWIADHSRAQLYLEHVEPLLDRLGGRGIRPILWHDMMRDWESDALRRLGEKADLCAWSYQGDPRDHAHTRPDVLRRFREAGIPLWFGTAYKGADGPDSDLPDADARRTNALAWMHYAEDIDFVGGVATAWSRYCTPGVQCEPIDAALDLLLEVGAILHDGDAPEPGATTDLLEAAGEYDDFQRRRELLAELAEKRRYAWQNLRLIHGQLALGRVDADRSGERLLGLWTGFVDRHIEEIEALAPQIAAAFSAVVPERWLREYVATRLNSLRIARANLEGDPA